jgi:hypothetical protein
VLGYGWQPYPTLALNPEVRERKSGATRPQLESEMRHGCPRVSRLLRAASSADLPVESSSQYELVINLKMAEALGRAVPAFARRSD